MQIASAGVVGCGTMGAGICEVIARAGLLVTFVEITPEGVDAGFERIRRSLRRQVDRGGLGAGERDAILGRIRGGVDYGALASCDLVVEAVPEVLALKQETVRRLDDLLAADAVLATNTSSLAVTEIAVGTSRPGRVLGLHFFNPAPVMELVELITTVFADPGAIESARRFALAIGKRPIVVRDQAGFLVNRLLLPYLSRAVAMYETGHASLEDIDAAMRLGCGHPMGPLALLDLIGLDTARSILERMHEQFDDARYAPRWLHRQLTDAGLNGRKSGRGFHRYTAPGAGTVADAAAPAPDGSLIAAWSRLGVVGAGTLGCGIAEACAEAGYQVVLGTRSVAEAEGALAGIARRMSRAVEAGTLDAAACERAMDRIAATDSLAEFDGADMVIEAVAEDPEAKRRVFAELDAAAKPQAVLATTTSTLPVIQCAMATGRPERVVGLRLRHLPGGTRLVEIARTVHTADEAVAQTRALAAKLATHGVVCSDRIGFIVDALLFGYLNDAVKMLADGYGSREDIDTAMRLGCGHPLGPFELMDAVGLDVALRHLNALHAESRHPEDAPSPLLRSLVAAGSLGRSAGRGFYVY